MNLGDTAVMVIVIIIAAGIMFVVPMALMADKVDDAAIVQIQEAANALGQSITTKSEVTQEDLTTFSQTVGATGVATDYDILIKIPDENPAKKQVGDSQTVGETNFIDITRTQIENKLPYKIQPNSHVQINVMVTGKNWVETLTNRDSSKSIIASYTGISK